MKIRLNKNSKFVLRAFSKKMLSAAGVAGVMIAGAVPAFGDDPIPSAAQALPLAHDSITGGWAPRVSAQEHGFTPFVVLYAEGFYNAAGGVKNSGWWNTLLDFGFELDFEKLGSGPAGGSLFFGMHWVENRKDNASFGDYTGAANPVSGLMAADQLRVFNLYYAQNFDDGRYSFKVGQIAIDDDFMTSEFSALFMNSAFGAMPSQAASPLTATRAESAAFPIYSVAAPGLWFNWTPSDCFAWQTGVYYGGPGPDEWSNHGFDWEGTSYSGAVVFSEITYTFPFVAGDSTLKFGVSEHFGKFDNFKKLNDGAGDAVSRGLFSLYAVQDVVLISSECGCKPVLGAFWRAGGSPQSDRAVVSVYADAGLNWFGPIPGREDDVAGIAVSCSKYASEFRESVGREVAGAETTLELTYQAKITPYFTLQGDVQFLFDPLRRDGTGDRETAVVLGLRSVLTF